MEEIIMHSIIRKLMMTLMAVMAMAGAWAQASAPAMPEAVINLSRFSGEWQANVTSIMGDKTYQFDYTVKASPVAGGRGSYWEEWGTHPDLGEMHTSDLLGYNPADKKLHCYTVDNMGTTLDQICEWKSPDHLYMEYKGMQNGKQVINKTDLNLTSDDEMSFTGSSVLDGKTLWSGSGTFHKVTEK
jgi:hypothetical protein